MRIIKTKVYKIDEHPTQEKCFEWIRENWYDLNDFCVNEVIDSLKALQNKIGGELSYSISQTPEPGEHLTLKNYDRKELLKLNANECPLTGVCYDMDIINALKCNKLYTILNLVHAENEYRYSDESLLELCISNEYEFKIDGEFIC